MPSPLRVLLVEDDEIQREAITLMLEDLGLAGVLVAEDGREGLEILQAAEPPVDLIVSDLQMPEMDGVEFLRRVGESGRSVGIVLVSAVEAAVLSAVENVASAYGITLVGTLRKPIEPLMLQRLLARYEPGAPPPAAAHAADLSVSLADIQEALAQRAFVPFFQPQVAFADGRLRGFEAVARWQRGAGLPAVGPDVFIPLMEAHGAIDELTLHVLAGALEAMRRWNEAGHAWTVSVNLSVNSLARVQFADQLAAAVREAKVPPQRIILEVTESASAGTHLRHVLDNLSRLRLKGFGLALDDFGTGYSSMQQLGRAAFTELKVDQSFVRDASRGDSRMALLASSVDTAKRLRIESVAEGVETLEDCRLLHGMGFTLGQGYFFARPLPDEEALAWGRQWPARLAQASWLAA